MDDKWNRELEELTARLLVLYRDRTTDMAPDTYTVDASRYTDEERFGLEVEHLFRRVPLLLALSVELSSPGDFKKLDIADVPVLVVRGKDGAVRSFVNVCRHRGGPVVTDDRGCAQRLICPYHAWSYRLDGSLAGVLAEQTFGHVDRDTHGLVELPCVERDGIVWGGLTPGADLDLDAHLGEFGPEIAKMQLGTLRHCESKRLTADCNWKLAADGYLESYHLAVLHPKTLYAAAGTFNIMASDVYGAHQRMTTPYRSVGDLAGVDDIAGKNPFDYLTLNHIIFPNTILLFSLSVVMVAQVLPGATVRDSVTYFEYFSRQPIATEDETKMFNAGVDVLHEAIMNEDYWIGAQIQRGLSSGAVPQLIFGRNELFAHHFHGQIDKAIAPATR